MATAKTTAKSVAKTTVPKPSKRKATTAKKSSKVKTKITKEDKLAASTVSATPKEEVKVERIVTERRQRVADRAVARESHPRLKRPRKDPRSQAGRVIAAGARPFCDVLRFLGRTVVTVASYLSWPTWANCARFGIATGVAPMTT